MACAHERVPTTSNLDRRTFSLSLPSLRGWRLQSALQHTMIPEFAEFANTSITLSIPLMCFKSVLASQASQLYRSKEVLDEISDLSD